LVVRIVIDTNVFVSAFLSSVGIPALIVQRWQQQDFEVVVTSALMEEYERALNYPRVVRHLGMGADQIAEIVAGMAQFSAVVEADDAIAAVVDDPDDDKIVACAVAGGADYIVTGDAHLLSLAEYGGIQIPSPRMFLTLLGGSEE
jgi:putative PIN family toxin of toxin-antitoxin system